jgi:hypothetical protein
MLLRVTWAHAFKADEHVDMHQTLAWKSRCGNGRICDSLSLRPNVTLTYEFRTNVG